MTASMAWKTATKRLFLGLGCTVLLASPAPAADMSRPVPAYKAPPAVMAPIYNWTGFYIGGHLGGDWAGSSNIDSGGRFLGGGQIGADWQFDPNWVVGVEGQFSGVSNSGNTGTNFAGVGVVTRNEHDLGSATARIGWTWGPGLLYAKGGYAFTDNSLGVTVGGAPVPFAATGNNKNGYTVGAGLEYMFAPNWSAKVEYQYYNFGTTTFTPPSPAGLVGNSFRDDEHTVKLGVNYRFGWH